MEFTLKVFLSEHLSQADIQRIERKEVDAKDLLEERVYNKYVNLVKWVRKDASLVRTGISQ
jgi:hypothetical protein